MDYPDFPPKHPLSDAIHYVVEAIVTANRHLHERHGRLTAQDMHFFDRLRETMWIQYFHSVHLLGDARIAFTEQTGVPPETPGKQN